MADVIEVEVLADGKVKMTTGKVSGANHVSAEALLREIAKEMGGEVERVRKGPGVLHDHDGHYHQH